MPDSGYLSDDDYRYVYSRAPRLCIDLVLVDKDGLLLTRRDIEPERGLWHTPGGRVRYKESLGDAAGRIAQKELGIEIALEELFAPMEFLDDGEFAHSVSLAFFAHRTSGVLTKNEEAREIRKWKELPPDMHPIQRKNFVPLWDIIASRMQ